MPGSAAFMERYNELLSQSAPASTRLKPAAGTLGFVIQQYKANSPRWAKMKPTSQREYDRLFAYLHDNYGMAEFATITERGLRVIRNKLAATPSVADRTIDMVGMLWRYAKEHIDGMDRLGPNPAAEVAAIHTESEPHKAWPPDLCAAVERHPNPAVVRAYYLLRYTGQRISDVAPMKLSQFDGTAIEVIQEKTGSYVWLPAHEKLREHLKGHTDPHMVLSSWGRPFAAQSLSQLIIATCKELGFPGYSPHGLRHLAGSALAEAGCSVHEIMSVLGHRTEAQAIEYVKQANRKVMASSAVAKWERQRNKD